MALYWPEQKVALDIVDDPDRRPFAGDESYTVIEVTMADIKDPVLRDQVMAHLRKLLKPGEADDYLDPYCARDLRALEGQGMRVVCVTDEEIADPSAMDLVAGCLADLLGLELPERTDEWLRARSKLRKTVGVPPYAHTRSAYSDISRHV